MYLVQILVLSLMIPVITGTRATRAASNHVKSSTLQSSKTRPILRSSKVILPASQVITIHSSLIKVNEKLLTDLLIDCSLFNMVNLSGQKPYTVINRLSKLLEEIGNFQEILLLRFESKKSKLDIKEQFTRNKEKLQDAIKQQAQLLKNAEKNRLKSKKEMLTTSIGEKEERGKNEIRTNTAGNKGKIKTHVRRASLVMNRVLITQSFLSSLKEVLTVYNSVTNHLIV